MSKLPGHPDPWHTGGGNNARKGLSESYLATPVRRTRALRTQAAVHASVVFDAECNAYIADMGGTVLSFSVSGKARWRSHLEAGVAATPALHLKRQLLYVGTLSGTVCALTCDKGSVLWSRDLPTGTDPRVLSDLLVVDPPGLVIASSWGGRFVALNSESGSECFSWEAGIFPRAAAAADSTGRIFCLRAVPGRGLEWVCVETQGREKVLHRSPEDQRGARRTVVAAAPLLDESRDKAYFIINHGTSSTLHAWSLKAEKVDWTHALPSAVKATPCVSADGVLAIADLQGSVRAIDSKGTLRWCYATGSEYLLSAGVMDGKENCFIGDPLGALHCIPPSGKGAIVSQEPRAIQGQPSISPDGYLYVPGTNHEVSVFRSAPANS